MTYNVLTLSIYIIFKNKIKIMYSFLICFVALIASYFIYGKAIEKIAGVDESNPTPVQRLGDGVDYSPMSMLKAFRSQKWI